MQMGVRACCGRGVGGVNVIRENKSERVIREELDEAVGLNADQG